LFASDGGLIACHHGMAGLVIGLQPLELDEAKFVFEKGCRQLIVGSGQEGNVRLSPEAETFFAKKNCQLVIQPTPRAIRAFNEAHRKKIGLFHVTC
jgi:hypothetical protein